MGQTDLTLGSEISTKRPVTPLRVHETASRQVSLEAQRAKSLKQYSAISKECPLDHMSYCHISRIEGPFIVDIVFFVVWHSP